MTDEMMWRPANNGSGKRIWFLVRGESVPLDQRYYYGKDERLVRYASMENAQRAADRLNRKANQ